MMIWGFDISDQEHVTKTLEKLFKQKLRSFEALIILFGNQKRNLKASNKVFYAPAGIRTRAPGLLRKASGGLCHIH
jgi:hypothetical protein